MDKAKDKAKILQLREDCKTLKSIRNCCIDKILRAWEAERNIPLRSTPGPKQKRFGLIERNGKISGIKNSSWTQKRTEEHLCMALFNRYNPRSKQKELLKIPKYGQYIVDYQTPIKREINDIGWGKIDLVGLVQGSPKKQLVFWEIKWHKVDNPLFATIELLAYAKAFDIIKNESKENLKNLLIEINKVRFNENSRLISQLSQPVLFIAAPEDYWEHWQKEKRYKEIRDKLKDLKTKFKNFKIDYWNLGNIEENDIKICEGRYPKINKALNPSKINIEKLPWV